MSSKLATFLGGALFVVSLSALLECGGSEHTSETSATDEQSADAGGRSSVSRTSGEAETDESQFASAAPTGELAPFETLSLEPSHPRVVFVDPEQGEELGALVVVGAPGMWPPATMTTSERAGVYLPDTGVETLRGRRSYHYEVMARASGRSMAFWDSVSFEIPASSEGFPTRRLAMNPAAPIRIRVTDGGDNEPVQGAEVRLARQTVGFVSLNKRTGPDGLAEFRAIPTGEYVASVDALEKGENRQTLTHAPPDSTSLTLQGQTMPDPSPRRAGRADDAAEESISSGPRDVELRLTGLSPSEWSNAALHWRREGGEWLPADWSAGAGASTRLWRRRLTPGDYQFRVVDGAGNRAERSIELEAGAGETTFEWQLALEQHFEFYVADRAGQPVEGALIQLWRGKRQIASAQSRGGDPVELPLEAGENYRVVAFDPTRGEAARTLRPGELSNREIILEIDRPLFSSNRPPDRLRRRERIEEILEVPVVRDGDAWLVDTVDPDSRAMRSGLKRADRLVSLHRNEDGWEVIAERPEGRILRRRLASASE